MNAPPKILAIGVVDELGIASTRGVGGSWSELGVAAPGNGKTYHELSGKTDQTFRRLNPTTRALVLAAEACGISDLLTEAERDETALIIETTRGCLEVDLRFARSLDAGMPHSAIFPYTLQSTCLGDVALRHGLRGPTLSLSVSEDGEGEALQEAKRVLEPGGPRYAVAGTVEVIGESLPTIEPVLRAVVCVLAAPTQAEDSIASWPANESNPFARLAEAGR